MRILIIKPSSLGDVVQALPTVNLIRQQFPAAHLAWLINDTLASLLTNCPCLDERIEFPRQQFGRLSALPQFRRYARQLRRQGFDLVIDLQGLFRSGLLAWATRAPRRVGLSDAREGARLAYTEVVPVRRGHAVDRYLLAARHLGCPAGPIDFPLGESATDRAVVDKLLGDSSRPKIAINPSARWPTKLWGDANFAALLARLPSERVVFTGTAADAPRIAALIATLRPGSGSAVARSPCSAGPLNLAGQTDLSQLAALYRRCAVVITNDSGPMHLAAAVGTPVVAIFGPTDPSLTGPHGQQHIVLRAGIPCSPCLKPYCTHRPRLECLTRVTVDQVLAAAKPFLA